MTAKSVVSRTASPIGAMRFFGTRRRLRVADTASAFLGISTAAQLCAVLDPSHHHNTPADNAERQLMALALNLCSRRLCASQGLDATCSDAQTVGQALAEGNAILVSPSPTHEQLAAVACQAGEINNGVALFSRGQ